MALKQTLARFRASVDRSDRLIATAHKKRASGSYIFSAQDREQITVAAFLNLFIAWEAFLESSLAQLMAGKSTIRGKHPKKYVSPRNIEDAHEMIKGTNRYFDYSDPDRVQRLFRLFFKTGYPYEPHFTSSINELRELRTMRNWAAHITRNTQHQLEVLTQKILLMPRVGFTLYELLVAVIPGSTGGYTVYATYKTILMVVAELIARG